MQQWVQGRQSWREKRRVLTRKPFTPHWGGSTGKFIPGLQRSRLSWEEPICHSHVRDTFRILSRVQPFLVAKDFPGSAALKL